MVIDSRFYMRLALDEAWKYQGLTYPNPAVGCTVVGKSGEILAVDAHKAAGGPHAEVEALRHAYYKITGDTTVLSLVQSSDIHTFLLHNHNDIFRECSLYTTLEPCSHEGKTPSCANLISALKIKKVYVSSLDTNPEASFGNRRLKDSGIEVQTSILQNEGEALLNPFRLWKEQNFIFFKWAQRLNGTTDGEKISSTESRKNVHAMRNVCDLLVIGGNTVRTDRPTLDARLVKGKAPDILILSREKDFDMNIPLFNVKERRVFIENNFSKLDEYKNIMIEGTASMYELSKEYVDYYITYIAPKFGGNDYINNLNARFSLINIQQNKDDAIMWMKKEV